MEKMYNIQNRQFNNMFVKQNFETDVDVCYITVNCIFVRIFFKLFHEVQNIDKIMKFN